MSSPLASTVTASYVCAVRHDPESDSLLPITERVPLRSETFITYNPMTANHIERLNFQVFAKIPGLVTLVHEVLETRPQGTYLSQFGVTAQKDNLACVGFFYPPDRRDLCMDTGYASIAGSVTWMTIAELLAWSKGWEFDLEDYPEQVQFLLDAIPARKSGDLEGELTFAIKSAFASRPVNLLFVTVYLHGEHAQQFVPVRVPLGPNRPDMCLFMDLRYELVPGRNAWAVTLVYADESRRNLWFSSSSNLLGRRSWIVAVLWLLLAFYILRVFFLGYIGNNADEIFQSVDDGWGQNFAKTLIYSKPFLMILFVGLMFKRIGAGTPLLVFAVFYAIFAVANAVAMLWFYRGYKYPLIPHIWRFWSAVFHLTFAGLFLFGKELRTYFFPAVWYPNFPSLPDLLPPESTEVVDPGQPISPPPPFVA